MISDPAPGDLCGCKKMAELVKQGRVKYEWFVCSCSPCERSYMIDGKHISECPFCKKTIPYQNYLVLKLKCPKCGYEW